MFYLHSRQQCIEVAADFKQAQVVLLHRQHARQKRGQGVYFAGIYPFMWQAAVPSCSCHTGARTLAAHKAVEALCEREGCSFAALAAHSPALGINLARLHDHVEVIREVMPAKAALFV